MPFPPAIEALKVFSTFIDKRTNQPTTILNRTKVPSPTAAGQSPAETSRKRGGPKNWRTEGPQNPVKYGTKRAK